MKLFLCLALAVTTLAQASQRSQAEIRAFRVTNPCPSTGQVRGPCHGYQVDHPDPICAGGADHRDNMQWLTVQEHAWKTRSDVRMCALHRRQRAPSGVLP